MTKCYVLPGEVATILDCGHMLQVNDIAIRRLVFDGAKDSLVDEITLGSAVLGYDEDGCYVKYDNASR